MDVIFVKPRHQYDSYYDLWELVKCSHFPVIYPDQIPEFDAANHGRNYMYIVAPFNGEMYQDAVKNRRHPLLLWNLERPGEDTIENYRISSEKHIADGYIDDVIVSDLSLALKTRFHFVPVGLHEDYIMAKDEELINLSKPYAFSHLMCYSNRRGFLFKEPSHELRLYNNLKVAPRGWDDVRDDSLRASCCMLYLHQDFHYIVAPLRFVLAMSYGLPIISEFCERPTPYNSYIMHTFTDRQTMDDLLQRYANARYYNSIVGHIIQARTNYLKQYKFDDVLKRFASRYVGRNVH